MVILSGNISAAMSADANVIKVDEQDHYHEDWVPPFDFRDGVRIKTNEKFSDYYELYEEIGEGKFGKVFRCVEKATNLILAAKCIRLKRDADLQKVENEVNIMTQMRHKCIAQIYDAFATATNNDVILIMEIVQGGELFDRVVDESYILTEMAVAMIVYQICEAIRYIHSQNIIHLDLKPENIMCVSQTGNQVKLIDFGLAQYFDGQSDLLFMAGTPEFAAPEVIKYEPLDFHTDMWSVGVITYILLSGQSPFLGENVAHTYCNVERGNWEFCEEFRENCISHEAQDFISRLLILDKNKRMLPDECLRHPWITLSRERSRSQADAGKPLDVGKLRSYVRNKRFRRLVFGVLFVNTIVRMMGTLQERKSEHGILYVKNMLSAANPTDSGGAGGGGGSDGGGANGGAAGVAVGGVMKSLFAKRKRSEHAVDDKENASTTVTATFPLNAPKESADDAHSAKSVMTGASAGGGVKKKIDASKKGGDAELNKSLSGEELHRRAKRLNKAKSAAESAVASPNATTALLAAEKIASTSTDTTTSSIEEDGGSGSGSASGATSGSPRPKRVLEKKAKRVKDASRKASSTEQAPQKRTKKSTPSAEIRAAELTVGDDEPLTATTTNSNNSRALKSNAPATPTTPAAAAATAPAAPISKLKNLEMFEQKGGAPFQLPVAGAQISPKKVATENASSALRATAKNVASPTKIVVTASDDKSEPKSTVDDTRQLILSATKVKTNANADGGLAASRPSTSAAAALSDQNHLLATRPKSPFGTADASRPKSPKAEVGAAETRLKPNALRAANATELLTPRARSKSPNSASAGEDSDATTTATGGKGRVGSMLKRLEQSDASAGGIKMAITGFIPPKNAAPPPPLRRHGSAEELSQAAGEGGKLRRRKSYKSTGAHKTTTVTSKYDEAVVAAPHIAVVDAAASARLLPLKLEHKTVNEQRTILKKSSAKKEISSGFTSDASDGGSGGILIGTTATDIASMRQKLRCTTTMPPETAAAADRAKSAATSAATGVADSTAASELLSAAKSSLRKTCDGRANESLVASYDSALVHTAEERVRLVGGGKASREVSSERRVESSEKFALEHEKLERGSCRLQCATEQKVRAKKSALLRKGSSSGDGSDAAVLLEKRVKAKTKVKTFGGEVEEHAVSSTKKVVLKPKKKLVKKVSVEKKKATRSLNDLAPANDAAAAAAAHKNVTFASQDTLLSEALEWAQRSTRRSLTTLAQKEHAAQQQQPQLRPKSENDVSQQQAQKQLRTSKTRSLHLSSEEEGRRGSGGANSFEHDAFDFSALRMKLQQRIMGVKDDADLVTEAENRHKCELRIQLHDSAAIKQTRNKWLNMDKEANAAP